MMSSRNRYGFATRVERRFPDRFSRLFRNRGNTLTGASEMVKDLTGKKFGRLTVLSFAGHRNRRTYWHCVCDCGEHKIIRADGLTSGASKSCGCGQKERAAEIGHKNKTHGMRATRLHKIYTGMKQRCLNPNNNAYMRYGGRGITICNEWLSDITAFFKWAIENGYNDSLTLDRIDNHKGYSPDNCRWATYREQTLNRNVSIKIGEKFLADMAKECGIKYHTLYSRVKKGMNLEDALSVGGLRI